MTAQELKFLCKNSTRKNQLNLFCFYKNLPMNQTHVERGHLKEYW